MYRFLLTFENKRRRDHVPRWKLKSWSIVDEVEILDKMAWLHTIRKQNAFGGRTELFEAIEHAVSSAL